MPFSNIRQFEKSFKSVKNLTPQQKRKAMEIFNAIKRDDPSVDDGVAIAIAIKRVKNMKLGENFEFIINLKELEADKKESIIEVLRVGTLHDRGLRITKKMLQDFVKNFENNVYGQDIPINLGHKRDGEAAGWVKDLWIENESLMARVEWTKLGLEKLKNKLYRFISAEFTSRLPHPKDGRVVSNVFLGAALTNIPALKFQQPITLDEIRQIKKMNMLKKFIESLKEREFVLKEDKDLLNSLINELSEDEREEIKSDVEEIENKPESPIQEEKDEKGDMEDDNRENEKTEELNEKLVEQEQRIKQLEEELDRKNLAEDVKSMLLNESKGISTGFLEKDKDDVVEFMMKLDEEQRKEFKDLISKIKTVDFTEKGSSKSEEVDIDLKANELAKKKMKMYQERGEQREFYECLAEAYSELQK